MKILNSRVWFRIECDCGNEINLTGFLKENHCEKCGKIYSYKVEENLAPVKGKTEGKLGEIDRENYKLAAKIERVRFEFYRGDLEEWRVDEMRKIVDLMSSIVSSVANDIKLGIKNDKTEETNEKK